MAGTSEVVAEFPQGLRVERVVTSGQFTLDGGTWDVENNVWLVGDATEVVVIDAAHDPDAVLAVWRDALEAPLWEGEPRWFHGDLHEGNLIVGEGRLRAVIDWGAAGRGDPAVELNAMWGYLPARVAGLYREAVGLDEAAYRRARGFALAPAISGWTYYRETAPKLSAASLETVRALVAPGTRRRVTVCTSCLKAGKVARA